MRYFLNKSEAINYALREIVDTLKNDAAATKDTDAELSNELENKIADIEDACANLNITFGPQTF
jgi:Arc/MetJ-type ribon-helix-helix transcriptional regulator